MIFGALCFIVGYLVRCCVEDGRTAIREYYIAELELYVEQLVGRISVLERSSKSCQTRYSSRG